MHPILLKVQTYLTKVANGTAEPIDKQLLFAFHKSNDANLARTFAKRPDEFRLRMSNVGRPLCQLQMEKAGIRAQEAPYYSKFRDTYGDLTESLAVLVLKAAGVKVVEEQLQVTLEVAKQKINGTLDLIIEEEAIGRGVWDVKSASGWAFNHKFIDFPSVAKDDVFGYLGQGYGYAEAVGLPFRGWIVVNKENGEWNVVPVPVFDDNYKRDSLAKIEKNVTAITEDRPFQRSYSDEAEVFKRKLTGNRKLGITCSYCPFLYACWPSLEYRSSIMSEAENPKKIYYTEITNAGKSTITEE